jgi:hypothetical protein
MFKKILIPSLMVLSVSSFAATNQSDQNIKPIKNIDNRQVLYHITKDPNYELTENILNVDPTYPINLSLKNRESKVYGVLQDTVRNYWFSQQYRQLLKLNKNILNQNLLLTELNRKLTKIMQHNVKNKTQLT